MVRRRVEGDMADEDQGAVPVSRERIKTCLSSATFWVVALPKYADRQQRKADLWAIAAGVLAAFTGLAIFPVLTDTSTDLEKAFISLIAFAAAICALVPRIMNYAEFAGQARELSSRYGGVVGDLTDLAQAKSYDSETARSVVEAFEAVKENKDALRGLPDRASEEIARIEADLKVLEAQARLDAAKAAASGGKPGA
jgi:hypothetical protein